MWWAGVLWVPGGTVFVLPGLIPSAQPSTLFLAKLFISLIGLVILCLGARLHLLGRIRERLD